MKSFIISGVFLLLCCLVSSAPSSPSTAITGGGEDRCPRPDEIAPCQCRTRGPTIQVRCTNSMMGRITEAMMNIRKRVESVDVLILENNNIPHLPSRAFGSVQVNRLFIENNRMSSVDRNAFAGVEDYLTEIYIKEPNLRVLPRESVDFLRKLSVFSVENSQISEMPSLAGLSELQLFRIDGSQIRDIPAATFKNLPSLRYLHVSESKLARLDIGVLENLHNLVLANFTGNEISWVHPRAFRYMEQMLEVSFKGNKLKDATMVGRAARAIKTLKKLDLSHNEITDLPQSSFTDIISLEELDLSHNRITDLKRMALHRLARLKVVDLSNNQIKSFHSDAFVETPLVEHLHLSHNALAQVTDVSFVMDSLPKLALLDLSDNDIRDIPFGALRGYPRLEKLYLANNEISQVSRGALADLPSLADLDLSRNKLIADALEGPIFDLSHLKHLNLSFNKLSKLNGNVLNNLHQLQLLDVSHNGIMSVDEGAMREMRALEVLNMSYNNIRELKPRTFAGLVKLKMLDVSHNELVALSDGLLGDQGTLEEVSFAYNQIQLVSSNLLPEGKNGMRSLDFTSNYIVDFPEELVAKLPGLTKLLFEKNSIQKLGKSSFAGLSSMEVMTMHDNRIEDIEEEAFKDLTALKTLDLSLNVIGSVGDTLEPLVNLVKLNLSDNYITSLPKNAFHALRRLSTLDVSNNTIVEIGKAFVDMPELKYLDLSYNHLPAIKEGSFKSLPSLISLHLSHNSIVELQANAFQELYNLEKIVLTKNGLPDVRKDTFRDLPSLEVLQLDDNLIKTLETRALVDLFSLNELHLQHNLLDEFNDRAFVRIPSLRFLNMSYNLVRNLPRAGFVGLETLETIDLSFNDIREVDERAFEELKWLAVLKLNDNNICNIRSSAFKSSTSLRSLSLQNNRLTRIEQETFGEAVQEQITRFDIAGNPLTCDCNTLWLRNWVSSSSSSSSDENDEPRCYFPKSLSGNPLRKLRSSRFTCDERASTANVVKDACSGIPLKTPAAAASNTPPPQSEPTASSTESVAASANATADRDDDSKENGIDPLDDDSVTVDSAAAPVRKNGTKKGGSGEKDDDYYEYYYVYYDDKGQVVSNASKNASVPMTANLEKGETKVQEIKLENNPVVTAAVVTASSTAKPTNDKTVGDTPTVYAEIQNKPAEQVKKPEEEKGMSIFGIPIPKLPISLSFGLAPALSQGLLPLQIGRKGDLESAAADQVAEPNQNQVSSTASSGKKKAAAPAVDQTRGPDILDPIWVETGLKAASHLWPHIKSTFGGGSAAKKKKDEEEKEIKDKREVEEMKKQQASSKQQQQQIYNYEQPTNPVIPLSGGEGNSKEEEHFPMTVEQVSRQGEYFPKGYIPAIQFNHPIPGKPGPLPGEGVPILPPPAYEDEESSDVTRRQSSAFPELEVGKSGISGSNSSPRDSVNGFIPLFRPSETINNAQHGPPSFDNSGPPKTRPSANKFPSLKGPSIQFTSPSNDIQSSEGPTTTAAVNTIGPAVAAVPNDKEDILEEEEEEEEEEAELEATPTIVASAIPDTTETVQQQPTSTATTEKAKEEEYYEEEYYDEDEKASNASSTLTAVVEQKQQLKESEGTERTIPTLQVEEVLTTTNSASSSSTTDPVTPKETTTTTTTTTQKVLPEKTTEKLEETTTTTQKKSNGTEYEYEYYEDEETGVSEKKDLTATTDVTEEYVEEGTSTQSVSNPASLPSSMKKDVTSITASPRSSDTSLFDLNGNHLESQRSAAAAVTGASVDRAPSARSSSPYPFHPDKLDPAAANAAATDDNVNNWYYSNYNSEGLEPFVGPGGADHRSSSSSTVAVSLMTILLSVVLPRAVFL